MTKATRLPPPVALETFGFSFTAVDACLFDFCAPHENYVLCVAQNQKSKQSRCLRGDGEIRTHDPLLARQVLSQLSYTPIAHKCLRNYSIPMGLSGLEPPTSRLSGVRSNRLSYKPIGLMLFNPYHIL